MNTYPKFINVTSDADVADALGEARADLAEVKARIDFLEGLLKAKGVTAVNGEKYRVAISYGIERSTIAWKAVAEHFKPSRQLLRAHTNVTVSDRVTVSALKKEV